MFLDSLDDWQSPPDSNCGRKFTTQPSGGIPFSEDATINEHGNATCPGTVQVACEQAPSKGEKKIQRWKA